MADDAYVTTSFRDPPPSNPSAESPSGIMFSVKNTDRADSNNHKTSGSTGSVSSAPSTPSSTRYHHGADGIGSLKRHQPEKSMDLSPHVDHYRDIPVVSSVGGVLRKRPTLLELHELDTGELVDDAAGEDTVSAGQPAADPKKAAPKFGWIIGVFVRCLLNIFGVMLFMRISWVVGQAGIALGTIIILLACTVTFLTALSMSAICTNGEVKGGGAYYMISRSLGPEFGGAIGIIFALANAVAVAMYVIGFAETIRDILKDRGMQMVDDMNDVRIIGFITIFALLGIALAGLDWEARAQVVLLVILTAAIANVMIGTVIPPSEAKQAMGFKGYSGTLFVTNFTPDFRDGYGFFTVFAIFFPAATGILAGANISGDLKDPQVAIPKGTILAIILTTFIYLIIAWMCGLVVERDAFGPIPEMINGTFNSSFMYGNFSTDMMNNISTTCQPGTCKYGLLNDMRVTQLIAIFGPITIAGIVSATLSSALASLISAPKVFQAVCNDKIFPGIKFFGKGFGDGNEPRRAYVLTFAIGVGCIVIGDLNTIAPLISNFFLMSYGLICYSCADSSLAKSPGWRPAFKYYNVWMSLTGTILCLVVMFLMDWITALITFAIVLALYLYVHYRKPDINWGSSTQAHVYKNALQHTQKLVSVSEHVKNFRPQLLVLSGMPMYRPALVDLFSGVSKKTSLMICGHVLLPDQMDDVVQQAKIPRTASSSALKQLAEDRYAPSSQGAGLKSSASNATTNGMEELIDLRFISNLAYKWLEKRKIKAFYNVIWANSLRQGVLAMMQSIGIGKLRPNTLILGFKSDWKTAKPEAVQDYFNMIHDAFDLNYGLGIVRMREGFDCTAVHADMLASSAASISSGHKNHQAIPYETHGTTNLAYYNSEPGETRINIGGGSIGGGEILNTMDLMKKSSQASSRELIESMDRFNRKKQDGTIDVWWLVDDGGLTLLVPYLLSTKKKWAGCKLRVFMTSSGNTEIDLDQEKKHMVTLLRKFRICYSSVTLVTDVNRDPSLTSLKYFDEIISDWMLKKSLGETKESHPWKVSEEELEHEREKTYRQIRVHELLKQYSMGATIVVVTLPVPRKGVCPSGLYLSWLDILTRDMPPVILLRGNQESVLTYYS